MEGSKKGQVLEIFKHGMQALKSAGTPHSMWTRSWQGRRQGQSWACGQASQSVEEMRVRLKEICSKFVFM